MSSSCTMFKEWTTATAVSVDNMSRAVRPLTLKLKEWSSSGNEIVVIVSMAAGLEVFCDLLSEPSRAVLLLLNANKVPYEKRLISLEKGEHKTDDYRRVNPNQQVPAIDDDGFCLSESSAIMRYIVSKHRLPDHWYPSDVKKRAKIDEYLGWHPSNLRMGVAYYINLKVFQPMLTGVQANFQQLEELKKIFQKSVKIMEEFYLKDHKFIYSDEISIADLQAVCEFTQFWAMGVDPAEGKPRLAQWIADCQSALQPHFDEVHSMVYLARDKGLFKGKLD